MDLFLGNTLKNCYRVDEFLGRGGMAEVYKVWDTQRGVPLAMKVLRDDLAEDIVFMRRFEREAQNLTRLQHPNIVRCYGLEQEGRTAFMLMDYIEGGTLRSEIFDAHGSLTMQRIMEIMQPVCSALHYAHQMGMVHCDVKSANIMIHKNSTVYLADFGIARGMDAGTSTMVGMGTPAYMAPELIKGQDPTPQTDIYALGIVLYEMLTGGERPFTGERATITGTTAEKVRWEHVQMQPVPVLKYNAKVSVQLEGVVQCCLRKDARERYATTMELLDGLNKSIGKLTSSGKQVKREGKPQPSPKQVEAIKGRISGVGQGSEQKQMGTPRKSTTTLGIVLIVIVGISLIIGIPTVSRNKKIHATQTAYAVATQKMESTATAAYEATTTAVYGVTATAEYKAAPHTEYFPDINKSFITKYIFESTEPIQLIDDNSSAYFSCESIGSASNLILEMTATNPADVSYGFDYGISFADSGVEYLLIFEDTSSLIDDSSYDGKGIWLLFYRTNIGSDYEILQYDIINNFYGTGFATNTIQFLILNGKGYLYTNNNFTVEFDLGEISEPVFVNICTDMINSYGKTGNIVQFDSVVLKEITN